MWVFLIMRYIFAEVEAEQNYAHNTACTYCWFYHSTAVQLTRAYMHACVCMYSCVFVHMFVCVCVCVICAIYYVLKPHKKIFVNSHTCMESKTDMSMICLSLSLRCIQACPTQDDAGQRGSFKGTPEGHRQTKMSHRAWCHTHAVFSSMEETSMNSPCHTFHRLHLITAQAWYWFRVMCTVRSPGSNYSQCTLSSFWWKLKSQGCVCGGSVQKSMVIWTFQLIFVTFQTNVRKRPVLACFKFGRVMDENKNKNWQMDKVGCS